MGQMAYFFRAGCTKGRCFYQVLAGSSFGTQLCVVRLYILRHFCSVAFLLIVAGLETGLYLTIIAGALLLLSLYPRTSTGSLSKS